MLTIKDLQEANLARISEYNQLPGEDWDEFRWLVKLNEEVGELCQACVKNKSPKEIQKEWADVMISLSVVGIRLGISNQEQAIKQKFNEKSQQKNSKILI